MLLLTKKILFKIEKLVACKRYVTAVNIIGHSECEAVINAECICKLMKLAGTEESIGVETLDDYAVQKIIGWFQQQEDIDLELRSDIEFIYSNNPNTLIECTRYSGDHAKISKAHNKLEI